MMYLRGRTHGVRGLVVGMRLVPKKKAIKNYYAEKLKRRQKKEAAKQGESGEESIAEDGEESDYEEEADDAAIAAIKKKHRVARNTWIIKPGENTNRGCGIQVSKDFD